MNPPHFFISFSSRDIPAVREIMAALDYQGFTFWDYSNDVQQIETGTQIDQRLFTEIDKCDYLLMVVSRNSVDPSIGRFTIRELEYALGKGMHREGKILPVLLTDHTPEIFSGPFRELENDKHEEFVTGQVDSLINLIISICYHTNTDFKPYIRAHPRLPFRELFTEEVLEIGKALKNNYYVELMRIISEFSGYYQKGNYQTAYLLITHFISFCSWRIPEYAPVYPYIAKAVCEQDLCLDALAENSYRKALEQSPNNPDALGGVGVVCMQTGRYEEAAEYSLRASQNSKEKQVVNERLNQLVAKSLTSQVLSSDESAFILDFDISGYTEPETNRILSLKAIFCHRMKRYHEADRFFKETGINNLPDPVSAIYYFLNRSALNDPFAELKSLLQFFITSDRYLGFRNRFYIYLAELFYNKGELDKFRNVFETHLLTAERKTRETALRYIRLLKNIGIRNDVERAKRECERYIEQYMKLLPENRSDYYYDGFARFLLGQMEQAQYDYERSGKFDVFYSEVEEPF